MEIFIVLICQKSKITEERDKKISPTFDILRNFRFVFHFLIFFCGFYSCAFAGYARYQVKIVKKIPHKSPYFTQGFVIAHNALYESSGLYDKSVIKKISIRSNDLIDLKTSNIGAVLKTTKIKPYFIEGLTYRNNYFYLLTWKAGRCLMFDKNLNKIKEIKYVGEGWGLASTEKGLWMSDGSHVIYLRNAKNFKIKRKIAVFFQGLPLSRLNELEYVKNKIYANVWGEDFIAIISPENGKVIGVVDLQSLVKLENKKNIEFVPNGIAWDKETELFYITGKGWDYIYVVKFVSFN